LARDFHCKAVLKSEVLSLKSHFFAKFNRSLINTVCSLAAAKGSLAYAMTAGAVGGFLGSTAGALMSGASVEQALKAGVVGGITGAAFGWAGTVGEAGSASRYLAHAVAGCGYSLAGGGGAEGCARGAASAVIGKYVTNTTNSWGVGVAQFTAATVAGGVTSVMLGGTFQNGAATAAYGYLFNYCAHNGCFKFNR
jgi:hypothetical protein